MKTTVYILLFLCSFLAYGQNDPYLKELDIYVNGELKKVSKTTIDELNETARGLVYSDSEKAEAYGRIGYELSRNVEYAEGQVDALMNIAGAMLYSNRSDSAMIYTDIALDIANRIKSEKLQVKGHSMKGSVHTYLGQYDKAIDEYFVAIRIAERNNEEMAIKCYANIGHVFKRLDNLEKSREYSEKAYKTGMKYQDTGSVITALNILGLIEKTENNPAKALEYFEEGLVYARQSENLERQSHILYNMANIYFDRKDYDKGFEFFHESVEISKVNGSYLQIAIGFHSLAITYNEIKRLREAAVAADSALHYGLLSENYEMIMEAYAMKAEVAKNQGELKTGFRYLELAYEYKDSLNLANLNSAALEAEGLFEKEKKSLADSLKLAHNQRVNDQKVRSREILLWISGLALILVLIGLYILFKKNKLVKAQNILVNSQKEEIVIQHQEITDSINYAKRIQEAIISNKSEWDKISKEHFILFKPKDVVSGDFYWAYHNAQENISIWAVADCTGHGVPGAFMSMLGIGFLNEIIIENGELDPGNILDKLRAKITTALRDEGDAQAKDGMDIAICVWDKSSNKLHFAGANNSLWLIRNKAHEKPSVNHRDLVQENGDLALYDIPGDKMPIGYLFATPPPFSSKEIQLLPDDVLVLLTDGYADQFGGEQGKKLKYRPLKSTLMDMQRSDFAGHEDILSAYLSNWMGKLEQVDDICIAGVKIN